MRSSVNMASPTIRRLAFLVAMIGMLSLPAQASGKRLAIKGYDPVAYFTASKATKGDPQITYVWDEAIYRFASPRHREIFKSDPDRYAPLYRGFCTIALSRGVRFVADPQKWLIHDGRLHIFGSGADVEEARKHISKMKKSADQNYKRLSSLPVKGDIGPKE